MPLIVVRLPPNWRLRLDCTMNFD